MEWEKLLASTSDSLLSSNFRANLHGSLNEPSLYRSSQQHLTHLLKGHTGSVNCLQWSHDGRWLLSGSDDQYLLIHKFTSGSDPQAAFSLKHRFETDHWRNIYEAKFDPSCEKRIVSVAADGNVCVVDDWTRHGRNSETNRTLRAGAQPFEAKSLEFVDRDNVLVACDDGHILQFDLRQDKPAQHIRIDLSSLNITPNSLASCPLAPHLLAIASSEPFVRIYDLRKSLAQPAYTWTPPLKVGKILNVATGVKFSRFNYSLAVNCLQDGPFLIDPIHQTDRQVAPKLEEAEIIKCAGLAREISRWKFCQAAYKEKKFALADKELAELIFQHRKLTNNLNWREILFREVFNRVLCIGQTSKIKTHQKTIIADLSVVAILLDHWPARYLLVMFLISQSYMDLAAFQCRIYLKLEHVWDNPWRRKIKEVLSVLSACDSNSNAQIPKLLNADFARICSEIPPMDLINCTATQKLKTAADGAFNGYLGHFRGVVHEVALKDISFVGDSDEFIGVSSDGGYSFIFPIDEKMSRKYPIWAAKTDSRGCATTLQSHPHLPCIATAGIDKDIKIWQPKFIESSKEANNAALDFKIVPEKEIPQLMKKLPNMQEFNAAQANGIAFYLL